MNYTTVQTTKIFLRVKTKNHKDGVEQHVMKFLQTTNNEFVFVFQQMVGRTWELCFITVSPPDTTYPICFVN